MLKKILFVLSILHFWALHTLSAQEIISSVTINTPKLQTADPKIFKSLKTALEEFLNNRKWTDDAYDPAEKIEMNVIITIDEELSQTSFKAQLTIQASDPLTIAHTTVFFFNIWTKIFISTTVNLKFWILLKVNSLLISLLQLHIMPMLY